MKPQHTPTPWSFDETQHLAGGNRTYGILTKAPEFLDDDNQPYHPLVCSVYRGHGNAPKDVAIANAALIVRAVNAHEIFKEQMDANASIESMERLEECSKATLISLLCAIRNQAQAALKTAKGEV